MAAGLAAADNGPDPMAGLKTSEDALIAKARQGRLGQDELIRQGDQLGFFTKLKLYYYALALEPYFEGVEDSFRDLARADPADQGRLEKLKAALARALARARQRLADSDREEPQVDWRRGLAGLIWLDSDWRRRVHEKKSGEIKNPYDLVLLLDCMDARQRGLAPGRASACPLERARKTGASTDEKP